MILSTIPGTYRRTHCISLPDGGFITWDQLIPTEEGIDARKPGIVKLDPKSRRIIMFEVAVTWDMNVVEKEKQKVNKYSSLAESMCRTYRGFTPIVVAVVIGVTGAVSMTLQRSLNNVGLEEIKIGELQKASFLGGLRIIRKVLNSG